MAAPDISRPAWEAGALADPHRQPDKADRVRLMFDAIATTYERVNRLTSAGRDAAWRRTAVDLTRIGPEDSVLDVACGTGDLAREFAARRPRAVVGIDFAANMLALAAGRPSPPTRWCRADALRLPFADGRFTVAGCAFGVRNFACLADGLAEIARVLAPGGRAVILEFAMPRTAPVRAVYGLYFHHLLPRVAGWISGDRGGAYAYLPKSVATFIDDAGMVSALRAAGFASVAVHRLTFGVAIAYLARKAEG